MTDQNNTEQKVHHDHLTPEEIKQGCITSIGPDGDEVRICRINQELEQGIREMEEYPNSVTFYGSARFKEGDEFYEKARRLAFRIAKELDFAVATGGGPGIMEGGNRGAFEAGGKSIGLSIKLPMEQHDNPYTTDQIPFYFFFTRKLSMKFSPRVCIFFPGGFGTFDEFFEIVTLVQTHKIKGLPIVLYGTKFWNPFLELWQKQLVETFHTVNDTEMKLFTVTDDDDMVLDIIKNSPLRTDNHED